MPQSPARKRTSAKPKKKTVTIRKPRRLPRHRQYGAIPIRLGPRDQLEILLLTSRGTGRWVIPKGWPMRSRTPAGTAKREAYEEAGVKGQLWSRQAVGTYRYMKRDEKFTGEILVRVFVLTVEEQKKDWPERGERRTRWFSVRAAAAKVAEPGLAKLLRSVPAVLVRQKKPLLLKKAVRRKK
jgi:8-oxo-dGTP pyrophosphatase MutT (NUDIX family)